MGNVGSDHDDDIQPRKERIGGKYVPRQKIHPYIAYSKSFKDRVKSYLVHNENLTDTEHKKLLAQLKLMYRLDKPQAQKLLDRLNFARRTEDLPALSFSDILKKESLPTKIKRSIEEPQKSEEIDKLKVGDIVVFFTQGKNKQGIIKSITEKAIKIKLDDGSSVYTTYTNMVKLVY